MTLFSDQRLFSDQTLAVGERLPPQRDPDDTAPPAALPTQADVAVIGAGVVGLSIAWRLLRDGLSVAVFDRAAVGAGTSFAAAGMLAAAAEHEAGGDELLALALESQRLWPEFRAELEAESGIGIDYRDDGTLVVAIGRDEVERLRFRYEHHRRSGLGTAWLSSRDIRALEPGLSPSVAAGLWCPDDHQVDPRGVVPALARAVRSRGGLIFENCAVTALDRAGGRIVGVTTAAGPCRARTVVAATGVWSGDGLLPPEIEIPVRPVKGQSLALRTTRQTGTVARVVWTDQVYLAPKDNGRLIVGATMEDAGFNSAITAGGVLALLEGVHRILPSSEEMEIEAIWSGFRPTSDDDAPILGATGVPGLLVATGHHRNGILLAPITAQAIAQLVTAGTMTGAAQRFGLSRFEAQRAGAASTGVQR
jgi:glycine oxidase